MFLSLYNTIYNYPNATACAIAKALVAFVFARAVLASICV